MALSGWAALILAAGDGSRFGGSKMLAPFAGAPLIRRTVEIVLSAGFADVVVVTGADHAAISTALCDVSCRIVHAPDWQQGLAASIRTGVASLPPAVEGLFLFLGDMPLAPVTLCPALATLASQSSYAARPMLGGAPGHPVCFLQSAIPDLAALKGDQGAGALLKGRNDIGRLATDDQGAVLDIDTPDALAAAEASWNARRTSATIDSAISRGDLPKPGMPIGA